MSFPSIAPVPRRAYGSSLKDNKHLPSTVPIIGLGCSSFSTFFWTPEEQARVEDEASTTTSTTTTSCWDSPAETLRRDHPKVQEWIETIRYAILECGVNLLDTAPWYGHGSSEIVIGWAMEELLSLEEENNDQQENDDEDTSTRQRISRSDLTINTKVGRYEADPKRQFDFSKEATVQSVQRSLQRLKCGGYIDVLQLHDPEFSPTLNVLLNETIPAMVECRNQGHCRALGMTGYPLQVQHQILQATLQKYDTNVWDQALTYGHFTLIDSSLVYQPILSTVHDESFSEYCREHNMGLLAAAPLSMGLLTHRNPPPEWHPAGPALRQACQEAADLCRNHFQVDLAVVAILFALSHPAIPCTILGMKNKAEVALAVDLANRFHNFRVPKDDVAPEQQHEAILRQVLTDNENKAYSVLRDRVNGPFSAVWNKEEASRDYQWDGVQEAHQFWNERTEQEGDSVEWEDWQLKSS